MSFFMEGKTKNEVDSYIKPNTSIRKKGEYFKFLFCMGYFEVLSILVVIHGLPRFNFQKHASVHKRVSYSVSSFVITKRFRSNQYHPISTNLPTHFT